MTNDLCRSFALVHAFFFYQRFTGKVYYELAQEREKRGIKDVAIARVEQISPFPYDLIDRHAADFPNADIVWCQEEPKNMGAWTYVRPRIETALKASEGKHNVTRPIYVGRPTSASTATGGKKEHVAEQEGLVSRVFDM